MGITQEIVQIDFNPSKNICCFNILHKGRNIPINNLPAKILYVLWEHVNLRPYDYNSIANMVNEIFYTKNGRIQGGTDSERVRNHINTIKTLLENEDVYFEEKSSVRTYVIKSDKEEVIIRLGRKVNGIRRNKIEGEKSEVKSDDLLQSSKVEGIMSQRHEENNIAAEIDYLERMMLDISVVESVDDEYLLDELLIEPKGILDALLPGQRRLKTLYQSSKQAANSENRSKPKYKTIEQLPAIIKGKKTVVIGEPGAGKTTSLRWLALYYVRKAIDSRKSRSNPTPIPFYVALGGYKYESKEYTPEKSFERFLKEKLISFGLSDIQVDKCFAQTRGITLLLDGLNEMENEEDKKVAVNWCHENKKPSIILSCRSREYKQYKQLQEDRWAVVTIVPFSPLRIYEVLKKNFETNYDGVFWLLAGKDAFETFKWYQSQKKKRNQEATLEGFWEGTDMLGDFTEKGRRNLEKLRSDTKNLELKGILGTVSNPFFLDLFMKLWDDTTQSATEKQALEELELVGIERNDIFDGFIRIAIENFIEKFKREPIPNLRIILSKLAFELQINNRGTHEPLKEVRRLMAEVLPETDIGEVIRQATDMKFMECDGADENDNVRFIHQLLQEFLAASELANKIKHQSADAYFPLLENGDKSHIWDETVVFLASMTDVNGEITFEKEKRDSTPVVNWLKVVHPDLAFRCAVETSNDSVLDELYNPPHGAPRSPIARAAWGNKISREGDERPGVGADSSDDNDSLRFEWITVPQGSFHMGGDELVAYNYWEGEEIDIPYSYEMTKYPVTNAQYEPFVEDGGYKDKSFWTENGWQWRDSNNIEAPQGWFLNIKQEELKNHPVVGLSWFECMAYAKWLTHTTADFNTKLGLPLYEKRLPTEAEWEKGGRYSEDGDRRVLPWKGKYYIPGSANLDETDTRPKHDVKGPYQLNRTTSVGVFDHRDSYLGFSDMSGNVWEWCLSPFFRTYKPHRPCDVDPEVVSKDIRCSIRGGSWANDSGRARLCYRGSNPPVSQDDTDGFRLVRVPIDSKGAMNNLYEKPDLNFSSALTVGEANHFGSIVSSEGHSLIQVIKTKEYLPFSIEDIETPKEYRKYSKKVGFDIVEESGKRVARNINHRFIGQVINWNGTKAYGYIKNVEWKGNLINKPDEGEHGFYMHQHTLSTSDWELLKETGDGTRVEFQIAKDKLYGDDAHVARNVKIVK